MTYVCFLGVQAFVLDFQLVWGCAHVSMNPCQLVECLPGLHKPWIWSPVSNRPSVGVHTCNPSSVVLRREALMFKVILDYTVSSKPVWVIYASKTTTTK